MQLFKGLCIDKIYLCIGKISLFVDKIRGFKPRGAQRHDAKTGWNRRYQRPTTMKNTAPPRALRGWGLTGATPPMPQE